MPDPRPIKEPIQKKLRQLVIATVVLYLALVGIATWNRYDANKVNDALCDLRVDQERQVATQKDFLRANPNGVPGISAVTIQQGINNRERTIVALSDLSC